MQSLFRHPLRFWVIDALRIAHRSTGLRVETEIGHAEHGFGLIGLVFQLKFIQSAHLNMINA
jgi:hypothetical protein